MNVRIPAAWTSEEVRSLNVGTWISKHGAKLHLNQLQRLWPQTEGQEQERKAFALHEGFGAFATYVEAIKR